MLLRCWTIRKLSKRSTVSCAVLLPFWRGRKGQKSRGYEEVGWGRMRLNRSDDIIVLTNPASHERLTRRHQQQRIGATCFGGIVCLDVPAQWVLAALTCYGQPTCNRSAAARFFWVGLLIIGKLTPLFGYFAKISRTPALSGSSESISRSHSSARARISVGDMQTLGKVHASGEKISNISINAMRQANRTQSFPYATLHSY
jgi:hypothetical protein